MKKLNDTQMRQVDGGRWQCRTCGSKHWTFTGAVIHCMGQPHFNGSDRPSDWVKWVW